MFCAHATVSSSTQTQFPVIVATHSATLFLWYTSQRCTNPHLLYGDPILCCDPI